MAATINIGGKLHSATGEGIIADAGEVYDETQGQRQSQLNATFAASLGGAAQESTLTAGITALQNAITALYGGDLTATLSALKTAIGNIDIDTTDLAKANALAAVQNAIDALGVLVGTTADTSTDATIFGKFAAVLAAVAGISGFATPADVSNAQTAIIATIQANAGVPTLTIPSTTASQELAPNTLYVFAERTTNLTLTLGTPIVGIANEYHLFLVVGSTAPTITWPTGITWNGGSAPTIAASKTYEVSILNNVAAYFEV